MSSSGCRYAPISSIFAVFPHVLDLLGQYDAESLFPPSTIAQAKRDLMVSMQGELSGSWSATLSALDAADMSA